MDKYLLGNTPNKICLYLCVSAFLLVPSCHPSPSKDARNSSEHENPALRYAPMVQKIQLGEEHLKKAPAKTKVMPAGNPVAIPFQGISTSEVLVSRIFETDSSRLHFITPGEGSASKVNTFTLPEPTSYGLVEIYDQAAYTIQFGDTVIGLAYTRAIQEEADPVRPMRMNESSGFDLQYLGIEQGLSNPNINTVIQDIKGNLWFGIQNGGLCRYDGSSLTRFTQLEGLFHDDVRAICEDSKGNIWVGTHYGICKYDGNNFLLGTFTTSLLWGGVNTIIETKTGDLWIGTTKGLIRLRDETFSIYSEGMGLPSRDIKSIIEDRDGNLWIGTAAGICRFDGSTFVQYPHLQKGVVWAIAEDESGRIWFGGGGEGLYCIDGNAINHYSIKEGIRVDLSSFQKGVDFTTIRSKDFVTIRKIIKL